MVVGGLGSFGKSLACLISGNRSINSICSSKAVITSSSSGVGISICILPISVKKTLLTLPSQLEAIIDPVLVTKSALKNAVSVALTVMSADCVISNVRIENASN